MAYGADYWVFQFPKTQVMRINVTIDKDLMAAAIQATSAKTKREAVELGLRTLLQLHRQQEIRRCRGKFSWVGDPDVLRSDP